MAYDAFISYSHAADGQLAPALQRGLQRLAKPWNRRRALHIFRDDTGLTVNPNLWSSIATAMDDSMWFVLLASPDAAASPWVNREIAHWMTRKPADHILLVLTDGTLVWDRTIGDYDAAASTALPAALLGTFADEPRHLDLRWARDDTDLDLRHSRFRESIANLAAPVHGVLKEELESEDVRRHRRTVGLARTAVATLAALLLAAIVTSGVAIEQRTQARHEANVARAQRLAAEATTTAPSQLDEGLLLAVAAHRLDDSQVTRGALFSALGQSPRIVRFRGIGAEVAAAVKLIPGTGSAAVGADNGSLMIWDYESERPRARIRAHIGPFSMAVGPDGHLLATSGKDGFLRLWDTRTGARIAEQQLSVGSALATRGMAISPDGRVLAITLGDGVVQLWGLPELRRLSQARAPSGTGAPYSGGTAHGIAFSPDGKTVALGIGSSSRVGLFDAMSDRPPRELAATHPTPVDLSCLQFSPDGRALAACVNMQFGSWALDVLDVGTGLLSVEIPPIGQAETSQHQVLATSAIFSPEGRFLFTAGTDGSVLMWERGGGFVQVLAGQRGPIDDLAIRGSNCLGPSCFPATLVTAGRDSVARWDLITSTSSIAKGFSGSAGGGSPDQLAVATRTQTIATTGSRDSAIRLWSPSSRRSAGDLATTATRTSGVAFTSDERLLAAVALDDAGTEIRFWDWPSRRLTGRIPIPARDLSDLAFSSDGRYLAGLAVETGGPARVSIFDVHQLKQHGATFGPYATRLAFSPVGMQLAVGGADGSVSLWDARTRRFIARLPLKSAETSQPVAALAFSPNGKILATASWDGQLLLWNTRTHTLLREPLERAERIQDLAFSPNGDSFASVGPEGQVKLWDVQTGLAVGELRNEVATQHVRFLDESHLVTVGNSILLWDLRSGALSSAACTVAGRNLTRQEWAQLIGGPYRRLCP